MSWYKRLPNAVKAASHSAWQAFFGVFGAALLGFLADVGRWAGDTNNAFPAVSPLGKAAMAGVAAAATFVVTLFYRGVQQAKNPAVGPHYSE